jgi:dihydrofolate reductase
MSLPIVAVIGIARNGAIGNKGGLPWPRCSADMKHFRYVTTPHAVIMGRRTLESIGHTLTWRMNICVSRTLPLDFEQTVFVTRTLEAAIDLARENNRKPVIIGGAEIYAAAAPLVDIWNITRFDADHPGDTFFEPDLTGFMDVEEEELEPGVVVTKWRRS